MLMEGIDFKLEDADPIQIGRKALAVNLSDIAAMAATPVAAVASVALPSAGGRATGEGLYRGMQRLAEEFDMAIVGGDTNSWEGPLVISLAVLGQTKEPVLRSGARPGDWLILTGPVGGSILGKHLHFTPRVREALRLRELATLHALIDISDGLAADLGHICAESRCGALLRAEAIPLAPEASVLKDGGTALEHGLHDGEDFELIAAVSVEDGKRLMETQPIAGTRLFHIGECIESGLWLEESGRRRPLEPAGYVHRLK
jgi:thiamine-monophosphate kinase